MSWKDNLLPASFRGVPFFYSETEREGGRRLAKNQFPLRDTPFNEDMGRKQKVHRITGYVLGDDYFAARDALESALDGEGAATLVHPFKGPLQVNCETYRVRETQGEGRIAIFDMEFVESGDQPSPTSAADTASAASAAAKTSTDRLQQAFATLYSIASFPGQLAEAARGLVDEFHTAIAPLLGFAGVVTADLETFVSGLEDLVALPDELAAQIVGFFSGYAEDVLNSVSELSDIFTSRGEPPVSDPSYGLADCAVFGSALPAIVGTTPLLVQMGDNQDAFVALVRGCATAALVSLYAGTDFASLEDAEAARDQVTSLLDGLMLSADAAGDDATYQAYMTLYETASNDLTTRGKQFPDVISYTLGAHMPALMLAERFYADAGRAAELVARNAAPHPLFMPLSVEALSV